jgi:hypothetical protein
VWRIHYGHRDGGADGVLIHVKPKLLGSEPLDLTRHAATRLRAGSHFPHDSTSDQFFDEAQFESYRKLGLLSGLDVMTALPDLFNISANGVLSAFLASQPTANRPTHSNAPPASSVTDDTAGEATGVWSKLVAQSSGWLAPALLTSAVAVTVSATVTGTLGLASNELKLANPQVTMTAPAPLLLDPNSTIRVEPLPSSVSISPDADAKQLLEKPITIGLAPEVSSLMEDRIRISESDLSRLEAISLALKNAEPGKGALSETEKLLNDLIWQVKQIDPQRVVQGN